ncbi:MAG: FecR family protein [Dysgonamonadaceae bacterium]|jgi:ferric-dicitrate binding protein FerR (iron transport regulator)|nr:FecR family protein [Dysgonamonadaceae bacterium]
MAPKELFRKYINGELTQAERCELKQWTEASDDNRELFKSFLSLYKTGIQIVASNNLDPDEAWTKINCRLAVRRINRRWRRWAAAASIALLIAVGGLLSKYAPWETRSQREVSLTELYPNTAIRKAALTLSDGRTVYLQQGQHLNIEETNGMTVGQNETELQMYANLNVSNHTPLFNLISTPPGSEYSLTLADGTHIWLNGNSSLLYPLSMAKERTVSLTGEGYFEVVSNTEVPFVIQVGNVSIRVTGTKFNVNAVNTDRIVVTLVEGSIEAISPQGSDIMLADEQLIIVPDKPAFRQKVNPLIYTSWTTGTFEFLQTPIGDILTQLSVWYGEEFVYDSPELREITFTGAVLKDKSLGYALLMIQKISGFRFEKRGEKILVKYNDQF